MVLKIITTSLIRRAERRVGVKFEYTHKIAQTDTGLLVRYNKIFAFLDPNKKVPALAYHIARLRGAVAADCGSCVETEINLAKQAGIKGGIIAHVLQSDYTELDDALSAVAQLADTVVNRREDDPAARNVIQNAYGEAGLIELSFAMNGAALLPGIKRAMGYATACDIQMLRKLVTR